MPQHTEIPSETCSLIPSLAQRLLESRDRAQPHSERHGNFNSDHDIAKKRQEFNIPPAPLTIQEITDNSWSCCMYFCL